MTKMPQIWGLRMELGWEKTTTRDYKKAGESKPMNAGLRRTIAAEAVKRLPS